MIRCLLRRRFDGYFVNESGVGRAREYKVCVIDDDSGVCLGVKRGEATVCLKKLWKDCKERHGSGFKIEVPGRLVISIVLLAVEPFTLQ